VHPRAHRRVSRQSSRLPCRLCGRQRHVHQGQRPLLGPHVRRPPCRAASGLEDLWGEASAQLPSDGGGVLAPLARPQGLGKQISIHRRRM